MNIAPAPPVGEHPHKTIRFVGAQMRAQAANLYRLASALAMAGNPALAAKLNAAASNLDGAERLLDRAVGEWIASDFCASVQASHNIINAALAMAARMDVGNGGETS